MRANLTPTLSWRNKNCARRNSKKNTRKRKWTNSSHECTAPSGSIQLTMTGRKSFWNSCSRSWVRSGLSRFALLLESRPRCRSRHPLLQVLVYSNHLNPGLPVARGSNGNVLIFFHGMFHLYTQISIEQKFKILNKFLINLPLRISGLKWCFKSLAAINSLQSNYLV